MGIKDFANRLVSVKLKLKINKIAFQSKASHPRTGFADMTLFCFCELDLDPMTLI